MYKTDEDEYISPVLHEINSAIENHVAEADQIIGSYWIWIQKANQSLKEAKLQAKSSGDKEDNISKRYSYIGPRIEKIQSGTGDKKQIKPKVIWSHYKHEGIRLRSGARKSGSVRYAQMGKRIKMTTNNEYKLETLMKYSVGWDAQKIIETERKLMPLREKIEALHKVKVEIKKVEKRVNRIITKHEEFNHG